MYAIVDIGGKQFKVSPATKIYVPSIDSDPGAKVEFSDVKLFAGEKGIVVGTPNVADAKVNATVLEHIKDDKVIVFKKKRRKGYRLKKGHRQGLTYIEITEIEKSN